jgi:succinate-semialdehyde dehydrogenase/glutarate-semialdehyde dehydrogenase
MDIKDKTLLRQQGFIDGGWRAAAGGAIAVIRDPADGSIVGEVPVMGAAETRQAIEAAARALPAWAKRTAKDRGAVLRRFAELMIANTDDLAVIMVREQGKPLAEAKGEIAYAASFLEWFAEEGKRVYGELIPTFRADARLMVMRQPVGVAAAITPWNFPAAMITRKLGPALAAGCTFVCKPAPQTPFSALALAELATRAGLPAGVFNVVTGDAEAIGGELTSNPLVRKLSFTGSTAVGKKLIAQCAGTVKKVSMELGGNAPFIVFDDADLDAAVQGAMASKYRNTGQTCVCANRFYVQSGVYDAFAEKLVKAVSTLRVGAGLSGPTEQGPLIDARALAKVESHRGGRQAPCARRQLLRADGAARCRARHEGRARGDLRAGSAALPLRHRRGSGAHGQRHRVRAGRLLLHPRSRPQLAGAGGARVRHRRRQHRHLLHRGRTFRRRQRIRARP